MDSERYVSIEITSSKIRMLIGFMLNGKIYVLHALECPTSGMKDGMIEDPNLVLKSLLSLKQSAEKTLQMNIRSCLVVLPPLSLVCLQNEAKTHTVSKEFLDVVDIQNVFHLVNGIRLSNDLSIIDTIPYIYILDDNDRYKYPPVGKKADFLTVQAKIYAMNQAIKDSFYDLFAQASMEVEGFIVSPLSSARYLALSETIPSHYFLLNIGEYITTISLIHGGNEVNASECYRFGGAHIVQKLQEKFSWSKEHAEEMKNLFGLDKNPSFEFEVEANVHMDDIAETIKESMTSILAKINKFVQINSKNEERKLPLVFIGGTSKLYLLADYLSQETSLEVFRPVPSSLGVRDVTYIPLLGAIAHASQKDDIIRKMNINVKEKTIGESNFDLSREGK